MDHLSVFQIWQDLALSSPDDSELLRAQNTVGYSKLLPIHYFIQLGPA